MLDRLFLDCEFNGHGGDLISLAIADPGGVHWYGILQQPFDFLFNDWVMQNVVPVLHKLPGRTFENHEALRDSLIDYLAIRQGSTIIADWPGDIRHLLSLFEGNTYEESWRDVRMKFQLITTPDGEPRPAIPHNALSDAIALMEWDQAAGQL